MCGIFGIIHFDNNTTKLTNFRKLLQHRGPNDHGTLYWKPNTVISTDLESIKNYRIAMGHQRLSILDLSSLGHQPMPSADGRWYIVYNGEVYNYRELRSELEAQGCIFNSGTDTEVVLQAIIHWGHEQALTRFTGMFALALLDTHENTLLLARDPFGIKPLYLCRYRDGLAFSSEIKPLLDLPDLDISLNAPRVFEYLRYGVTDYGDQSMLKGIHQIPSASWVKSHIDNIDGFFNFNTYWDIEKIQPITIGFDEAVEKFRSAFLHSIKLHLRSDVPIGCALSGGLDSSAIACAVRHLYPHQEIHTFSFIANEEKINESKLINIVNQHIGAIAHPIYSDRDNIKDDLNDLLRVQEEPFGSTSIYAQYLVMREAKRAGITVMLDGQGADEMLGGYPWYQSARWLSLLRQSKFKLAWKLLRSQPQSPDRSSMSLIANTLNYILPPSLLSIVRTVGGHSDTPSWMNTQWFSSQGVKIRYPYPTQANPNQLQRVLKDNLSYWGLAQLLRYEDRNSMAFSIESRVPFLTTELVELALSLPEEYLISHNGTSKYLLREALRGIVPDIILDRRDKIGFATPEATWIKNNQKLIETTIKNAKTIECLNDENIKAFIENTINGKSKYNSSHIWKIINFVYWHDALRTKAGK